MLIVTKNVISNPSNIFKGDIFIIRPIGNLTTPIGSQMKGPRDLNITSLALFKKNTENLLTDCPRNISPMLNMYIRK